MSSVMLRRTIAALPVLQWEGAGGLDFDRVCFSGGAYGPSGIDVGFELFQILLSEAFRGGAFRGDA